MRERHSVLVLHIGTFTEEDEAYKLLNSLSQSLPFVVMVTSLLDGLLAAAYLKWLHPWKILLQKVSSLWFLNSFSIRNKNTGSLRCTMKKNRPRRWP